MSQSPPETTSRLTRIPNPFVRDVVGSPLDEAKGDVPRINRHAYEQVLKASHTFNLLDARRAISVTERQRYILRVRALASAVARAYYESREALGFPLVKATEVAVPAATAP